MIFSSWLHFLSFYYHNTLLAFLGRKQKEDQGIFPGKFVIILVFIGEVTETIPDIIIGYDKDRIVGWKWVNCWKSLGENYKHNNTIFILLPNMLFRDWNEGSNSLPNWSFNSAPSHYSFETIKNVPMNANNSLFCGKEKEKKYKITQYSF